MDRQDSRIGGLEKRTVAGGAGEVVCVGLCVKEALLGVTGAEGAELGAGGGGGGGNSW